MKENWKVGKHKSCVVSDFKHRNTNFPTPPNPEYSEDDDVEYYGGYLVCESVGNKNTGNLIAAAPEMLRALENLENDDDSIPEHAWKLVKEAIKKAKNET